jgi:hypothetical protein
MLLPFADAGGPARFLIRKQFSLDAAQHLPGLPKGRE